MKISGISIILFFLTISCNHEEATDESATHWIEYEKEVAENIEMLYSDSARVIFRIRSPRMEKYDNNGSLIEEFPLGLTIEFLDENKKIHSSLSSQYARRISGDGTLYMRDSVVITNAAGDKLETNAIVWDEIRDKLSTKKFIRLIRASTRDTLYGLGFEASGDFSRFELQQFAGKRLHERIAQGEADPEEN